MIMVMAKLCYVSHTYERNGYNDSNERRRENFVTHQILEIARKITERI